MSCLYVFSCCCPLLCSFSLFFIVIEGLLILLSICIIYDKACRIIFRSITVPCKPYSRGAQNSVLLRNVRGYTDSIFLIISGVWEYQQALSPFSSDTLLSLCLLLPKLLIPSC